MGRPAFLIIGDAPPGGMTARMSWPYAYYTFLWIVCCGCFGYTALRQHSHRRDSWTFAFAGLAVSYNPVFRVHLDRMFWGFVNILTVVFLIVAYWKLHRQPP